MKRRNSVMGAFSMGALTLAAGCGGSALGSPMSADIDAASATPAAELAQFDGDAAPGESQGPTPAPEPREMAPPEAEGGDAIDGARAGDTDADAPRPDADAPPLLIYTAQLTVAVLDVEATVDRVEQIALDRGGYLLGRDDHSITVRIPAPAFSGVLDTVESVGEVVTRNVQARDVTEEVRDLRVRLDNARAMRKRLEHLLERANDVKSALSVERELQRIAEQIERLTGRLKRLRELTSFSTLTVRVTEQPKERVNKEGVRMPFSWLGELGLVRLLDLGDRR